MPRKGPAPKRPLVVDPVYGSPLVTQLVNKILLDGKKSIAERIVYDALEGCREKTGTDPVVTLKRALDNIKPALEVKSRRVGGATYQVPIEVKPGRATTLSLRWLVGYSRQRREKTMTERLMNEILDASNGLGAAVKRRDACTLDGGAVHDGIAVGHTQLHDVGAGLGHGDDGVDAALLGRVPAGQVRDECRAVLRPALLEDRCQCAHLFSPVPFVAAPFACASRSAVLRSAPTTF